MGKVGMGDRDSGRRIVDMRNREVGAIAPRQFSRRAAASLDIVLRLRLNWKLKKHRGCVNSVSFNSSGNILVSGSDDRMVMLWDWEMRHLKLSFHSGHINNVFQAKFMPYTDDRTVVTCAADGEVRMAQLKDGGHVFTRMLARHAGRAHKMAIEPGSPYILYSCGEDGLVHHFDLRIPTATKLFKCKTLKEKRSYMPIVHLNSIAIDPRNQYRFAVAGSDVYARVYDIRMCRWDGKPCGKPADCFVPFHLIGDDLFEITGLAFSDQSELLASYNSHVIYLFLKDQGLGPNPYSVYSNSTMNTGYTMQIYKGHINGKTIKGVSFFGPNCEYVTSGSDCGRLFIWRKKGGELLRVMKGDKRVVNCIESHPCTSMLASCGIKNSIKIWLPNAAEQAALVDLYEIMKIEPTGSISSDATVFDVDDYDDVADDADDSADFLNVDESSYTNSTDESIEDNDDDDDDDDGDDDDDDDDDDNDDDVDDDHNDDAINGLRATR